MVVTGVPNCRLGPTGKLDFQSIAQSIACGRFDGSEARGFRLLLARNQYGFLDPVSDSPKKWSTYVYYNDSVITSGSCTCGSYCNWTGSQWLSVSQVDG
jgi:hypothetical protein